jgi:hypothetical protein
MSGVAESEERGRRTIHRPHRRSHYLCPAGVRLAYRCTNEEDGKTLRRYWTSACQACALKSKCTTGQERRISRWEREAVLETVQARLDRNPDKMRVRRHVTARKSGDRNLSQVGRYCRVRMEDVAVNAS